MVDCAGLPNVLQPDLLMSPDHSIVDYESKSEKDASDYQEMWTSIMDKGSYKNPSTYRKVEVLMLCWAENSDDLATKREVEELKVVFEDQFHYHARIDYLDNHSSTKLQLQVNAIVAGFAKEHDGPNTLFIVYYAGHGKPGDTHGQLVWHGKTSENDTIKRRDILVWNKTEDLLKDAEADVLEIFDW
ncbi:hypothetical protein MMC30_004005 [Trapelia coarctata]|nr:hypothetical protein [Trapelia coarctata]